VRRGMNAALGRGLHHLVGASMIATTSPGNRGATLKRHY
jgi:hypothetical protein